MLREIEKEKLTDGMYVRFTLSVLSDGKREIYRVFGRRFTHVRGAGPRRRHDTPLL